MADPAIKAAILEALAADPALNRGELARRLGVSKNVVAGLAGRNGYSDPARSPIRPKSEPKPPRPSRKVLRPVARLAAPAPVVAQLFRRCQWIEGQATADDSCKCGAATAPGKPYCPEHCARAYRRAGEGEEAA